MKHTLLAIGLLLSLFSAAAAAPQITVHVARAAYPGSPNFDAAMVNLIQDVRFGRLEFIEPGTLPATPTNYATYRFGDKLTWQALTSTTNVPSYNGVLGHAEPFHQERGFCPVTIVDARSADGSDSINLRQLRVSITSSDPLNTLGFTPTFQGHSYYTQAIGIKADGSVLDFYESGDIMVARIIVRVSGIMYTGESESAISGIANYFLGFENFAYMAEAWLGEGYGKTVIESNPTVIRQDPVVSIVNGRVTLTQGTGLMYLESSTDMVSWSRVSDSPIAVGFEHDGSANSQFFRVFQP